MRHFKITLSIDPVLEVGMIGIRPTVEVRLREFRDMRADRRTDRRTDILSAVRHQKTVSRYSFSGRTVKRAVFVVAVACAG